MNFTFLISLWATFLVIRVWTHNAQDLKNYGTKKEKSFTLTGIIRARTGYDLHHIHFGFLLTLSTLIYIYFNDFSFYPQIALGVGISLITDQVLPLLNMGNYFSRKMILSAVLINLVITILIFRLF